MKQKPSLQFYTQDFLGSLDVQIMSAEEVGVYCLMLFNCFNNGGVLPNDAEALSRLCRGMKPTKSVLKKFYKDGEFLRNERIDFELKKIAKFSKKMKDAAEKRWKKGKKQDMPTHSKGNAEGLSEDVPKVSSSTSSSTSNDLSNDKSSQKRIFTDRDIEFALASYLLQLIQGNNPKAKGVDLQKWASIIDKMLRLDNRTPEEVKFIIGWSQQDSFWKANILSAAKLREKFDQLFMKAKTDWEKQEANKIVEV